MSLVALDGTPLVVVGGASRFSEWSTLPSAIALTNAAAAVASIFVGQIITEDGGSHTIDTTGSSSIGWKAGTTTFTNAGSTVVVGLAAVDTANGPPARAANSTGTISFSASKSLTGGGGGIPTGAWQEHVPSSGSLTIANGDLVAMAVQMTAKGGADSIVVQAGSIAESSGIIPSVTTYNGTTFAVSATTPNAVITFSDGKLGFFAGGCVFSTPATTQNFANNSALTEYGNAFQSPFPMKIYGFALQLGAAADCDVNLYSDPFGTPVAQKTYSIDANTVGANALSRPLICLFASPYQSTANQPLAAVVTPTTTTNVSFNYLSFNSSAHQKSLPFGANGYAVNRASGAFAAQNSNKDRFSIGLLVGAFDSGAGGGVSSHIPALGRGLH